MNALDTALRLAIVRVYPHLGDIDLVNYKVRILDENKGTGAVTRVLLDASDGERTWGSIGVSENIIEASWQALVDSIEFGMLHGRPAASPSRERRRPGRAAFGRVLSTARPPLPVRRRPCGCWTGRPTRPAPSSRAGPSPPTPGSLAPVLPTKVVAVGPQLPRPRCRARHGGQAPSPSSSSTRRAR